MSILFKNLILIKTILYFIKSNWSGRCLKDKFISSHTLSFIYTLYKELIILFQNWYIIRFLFIYHYVFRINFFLQSFFRY